MIDTNTLSLPLGWNIPYERVRSLESKIVPDGPIAPSEGAATFFGNMADNAFNIRQVEALLDPSGGIVPP